MSGGGRRVYAICEGQTEEVIAKQTLVPHLLSRGVYLIPWIVRTKRPAAAAAHRGGGRWRNYLREIRQALTDQDVAAVTTMIDLYGYPSDAPGAATAGLRKQRELCLHLEEAMAAAVDDGRFRPYLQLHEVEALLFADPTAVARRAGDPAIARSMETSVTACGEPELVDDGQLTHPSARLGRSWPRYAKASDGPSLVADIGLSRLRRSCPHFDAWVTFLEEL